MNEKYLLSKQAADKIVALINEKKFQPGDKIPNEYELSSILGVSRSTVREAIKALVSRNVLCVRRGVGTFVSETPGFIDDPWGVDFIQDKVETARQLLDIRLFIEPELAALAAENASADDRELIMKACSAVEDAIFANRTHNPEDEAFHIAVAAASRNEVALSIMKQVFARSIPMQAELSRNSLLKETIDTHSRIARAIMSGDKDLARSAMREHIEFNKKYVKELL